MSFFCAKETHIYSMYTLFQVWGKVPNERYRPSLGATDEQNTVVIPFQLSGEIVRGVVTCGVCQKPRCYYSRYFIL